MIRNLLAFGIAGVAGAFIALNAEAQTSGTLDFTYNGTGGDLAATVSLNLRPPPGCTITFRGGVHYEGATTFTSTRVLSRRRMARRQVLQFDIPNLPGVENSGTLKGILSLQARVSCRRGRINVVTASKARYVHCGASVESVAPKRFLQVLSGRLRLLDGKAA